MNHSPEDIKEAYREKLHARIGNTPSFNDIRSEFPSDAIVINYILNGDIKLDGKTVSLTICKDLFKVDQKHNLHDNNETEE